MPNISSYFLVFIIGLVVIFFLFALIFSQKENITRYFNKPRYEEPIPKQEMSQSKPISKPETNCTTESHAVSKNEDHSTTDDELVKSQEQIESEHSEIAYQNEPPRTPTASQGVRRYIDEEKGFFRLQGLRPSEVEYLLRKNYVQIRKKSIVSGKQENFLIRPRFNESINHMFVVHDIAEFLRKKGIDVQMYVTVKPDITFKINKMRFAVEVETGTKIVKDKKVIMNKVEQLKSRYDFWFFVVLNRNYARKYKEYGKAVELRSLQKYMQKLTAKYC
jgi:hypothetical protein